MTAPGLLQLALYLLLLAALAGPTGAWLHRVMNADVPPGPPLLDRIERAWHRAIGVDGAREMRDGEYLGALLAFSAVGLLVTFFVLRFQSRLPLNPQGFGDLPWHLALNVAASFTTNTNWQSYAGESTLSFASQAVGLVYHNFTSAAVGLAAAVAMARGITRRDAAGTVGNFWRDLFRTHLFVLLPACTVYALFLVASGVPQTWGPYVVAHTLEGREQVLALGPVASQVAIKMLGTNGGGFFNANAAHPFENPTPLVNLVQALSILVLPAGLVDCYGRMTGDRRQGYAILAAMSGLLLALALAAYAAEASWFDGVGSWEGKETRFGIAGSALFATVTTAASCGAVNAVHDSFTPLGGMVPLLGILLGEVVFGGVGAGLYGTLVMVVLTVFLAGLLVGRTPEVLGKRIGVGEVTLVTAYLLVFPAFVLVPAAIAASSAWGLAGLGNPGPHGWTEILYAFASAAGNNGSAFAGLAAGSPAYNLTLAVSMLAGRFAMLAPALALGGRLAGARPAPPSAGTFPTDGASFAALLVAVIVVVGALTYFPALALGPLAEQASLPDGA